MMEKIIDDLNDEDDCLIIREISCPCSSPNDEYTIVVAMLARSECYSGQTNAKWLAKLGCRILGCCWLGCASHSCTSHSGTLP